jgi:hypothetical protein
VELGAAFGVDEAWHESESGGGNTCVLATRRLTRASTRNNGVGMIQLMEIEAPRCWLALKILKLMSGSEGNVAQV